METTKLSWLGEYARINREWTDLLAECEAEGTDPTDNAYERHDRALVSMASWAQNEIASLQDQATQLAEAIERIEYAHAGSEYVTGEGVQGLDEAIRAASEIAAEVL